MTIMPFEEFEKKVLHTFDLKRPTKIAYDCGVHQALRYLNLEKTADKGKDIVKDIAGYAGALTAASLGSVGLAGAGMGLEGRFGKVLTDPEITKLRNTMGVPKDITHSKSAPTSMAAHYNPKWREVITAPKTPAGIVGHEFGHARSKTIRGALRGPNIGALGALAALPVLHNIDPESTAAKVLPAATVVPHLPRLLEEGRASARAYRALRRLGHGRSSLLSMLPAFGTYLAGAATPAAALEWIRRRRIDRQ
jgi:hypothetical protein